MDQQWNDRFPHCNRHGHTPIDLQCIVYSHSAFTNFLFSLIHAIAFCNQPLHRNNYTNLLSAHLDPIRYSLFHLDGCPNRY